ncbi:MAG: ankyrin repeat domain-containing protein, partial [Firmicutes bacterium]|nr:ankyrin repeat domain-containing protein [Bacillota bacterium]
GDPEIINALIAAGADVNAENQEGRTPLMFASCWAAGGRYAQPKTVKALLAAGADANAADAEGDTPLMLAVDDLKIDREIIIALITAGTDVNAENDRGETALDRLLDRNDLKEKQDKELLRLLGATEEQLSDAELAER